MPHSMPESCGDLAVAVGALLVEDPPDDQHAGPEAGGGDHASVAAGKMEGAALGALEQEEREHAGGDEQDGGLDERERSPAR